MPMSPLSQTPPSTEDSVNFSARADSLFGDLPTFIEEATALEANVNAKEASAVAAAATATTQATAAATSASQLAAGVASANLAAEQAAVYAQSIGATVTGSDPVNAAPHMMLGSAAYVNKTWLYGAATYDPPSLAVAASTTTTVAVPGAEFGDFVRAAFSADMVLSVSGRVSAADVVALIYTNNTAGTVDAASHTVYVQVEKRIAA